MEILCDNQGRRKALLLHLSNLLRTGFLEVSLAKISAVATRDLSRVLAAQMHGPNERTTLLQVASKFAESLQRVAQTIADNHKFRKLKPVPRVPSIGRAGQGGRLGEFSC